MSYQRNLMKIYSKYVAMKPLLTDLGISSSNYYAYMAGEDTRLSEEVCGKIIRALQQRPINYQPEPYPCLLYTSSGSCHHCDRNRSKTACECWKLRYP